MIGKLVGRLSLFVIFAVFAGCATTFVHSDFVPVDGKLEPPQLVPTVDPTMLRIDLIHRKTIRSSKSGVTTTIGYAADDVTTTQTVVTANTEAEEVEYSPLCIALGNGLTVDTNGNLFFSPAALYSFKGDYRLSDDAYSVDFHDSTIVQKAKDLFGTTRQFEIDKNEVFDLGNSRRPVLSFRKNSYYLSTYNMFGVPTGSQAFTQNGNQIQFKMERTIDTIGTSTLKIDAATVQAELKFFLSTIKFSLTQEGNLVRLKYSTPTLNYEYTIQRSADEILVASPKGYGMRIKIGTDKIDVDSVQEPDPVQALFGGNRTHRTIAVEQD